MYDRAVRLQPHAYYLNYLHKKFFGSMPLTRIAEYSLARITGNARIHKNHLSGYRSNRREDLNGFFH